MSFYPPEQRCPRCRAILTRGAPICGNCGLALTGPGGAPRASRSGPQPSWQSNDAEEYEPPSAADRFGGQGASGPTMYRPGGQFAPRGSGPWIGNAGAPFQQPPPEYQQRSGPFDSFSGADNRGTGSGDMSTRYQRPTPDQSQPFAGWNRSGDSQRPFADSQQADPGRERASGYQQPTQQSGPGWGRASGLQRPAQQPDAGWERPSSYQRPSADYGSSPTDYQRPPATSRDTSAGYQGWGLDAPRTSAGFYQDEAASYGRNQSFRGASSPMYQPGGQTWQQPYAGAPTAYPGTRPAYNDPFAPADLAYEPPMPGRGKKIGLILLVVLALLGAVGGGAAYLFLGSRPIIAVSSKYMVGTTPAGASTTSLSVTGSRFAPHSAVSFWLDGQPEPGHATFQSDASGSLKGDLKVTADWPMGQHTLTAKDASGNATFQGKTIVIVTQGEANTPGPKGAPADDQSFKITLTVHAHDKTTGENYSYGYPLVVTGQPDPAGGMVCSPKYDNGQTQSLKGTTNGVRYTITYVSTCSGTYKGGAITYTQTYSDIKYVYSNGVTCTATAPFVNQELDGSFTTATSASGTLSSGTLTINCSNGRTGTIAGTEGTWRGSIAS